MDDPMTIDELLDSIPAPEFFPVKIKLPPELFKQLRKKAEEEYRSIPDQAVWIIKQSLSPESVKKRGSYASPKQREARLARIKSMNDAGYSKSEIASALGISSEYVRKLMHKHNLIEEA